MAPAWATAVAFVATATTPSTAWVSRLDDRVQSHHIDRLRVEADRFVAEDGRYVAEGSVRLRTDRFRLTADRLRLWTDGDPKVEAEGLRLTPCACDDAWSIGASRGVVDADGATLQWPVFYVGAVPIFALPYGYWPLGNRRSGVLPPTVRSQPAAGLEVALPVFWAIDRSWDLTWTPGHRTARGPFADIALRHHVAPGVRGELTGQVAYDARRVRYRLWGTQVADLDPDTRLSADVDLLGDAGGHAFAATLLQRQAETARTRITVVRASAGVRIAAGLQWLQDLRPRTYPGRTLARVALFDDPEATAVRQRWAEIRVDAAPTRVDTLSADAFTFTAGGRASVQAFGAPNPDEAQFFRADLGPAIGLSAALPAGLVWSGTVRARATTWVSDAIEGSTAFRVAPHLATRVRQTLGRAFGRWFHVVRPEVSAVYVPVVEGRVPAELDSRDDLDLLGAVAQLKLRLYSALQRSGHALYVDAWSGQDFRPPGASVGAGVAPFVFRIGGRGRMDAGHWSVDAAASVEDWAGRDARLGHFIGRASVGGTAWAGGVQAVVLGREVPDAWFVAPDTVLPSRILRTLQAAYSDQVPWRPQTSIEGWFRVQIWRPLSVSARLMLSLAESDADLIAAYGARPPSGPVQTASLRARYVSMCDCWSVAADAAFGRDVSGLLSGLAVSVQLTLGPVGASEMMTGADGPKTSAALAR